LATLHRLNDQVNRIAQDNCLTDGQKMRADGTVVDTNIDYSTDSSLLSDSVRVIGRQAIQALECLTHGFGRRLKQEQR
jgi:hypothetical protein